MAATTIDTGESRGKGSDMDTIRTYELFDIEFPSRGSRWTGFDSADEASRWAGDDGVVVRRTFEVLVRADRAYLYQPGIAERPA